MPAEQCPSGHTINSAADRDNQGYCRECKTDRERRRRAGNSAALMVVRVFEKAGVRFAVDGDPADPTEVAKALSDLYVSGAL